MAAITARLRDGGHGQLRAACGTGKTRIASAAAELAGGGVVVVLVPSIALAAQTITTWQAGCPVDRVLAVCSDYTVGGGWVRASDLAVPVSTDPEYIPKWVPARRRSPARRPQPRAAVAMVLPSRHGPGRGGPYLAGVPAPV